MVAEGLWGESKGQTERERGTTRNDREKLPWNGKPGLDWATEPLEASVASAV